MQFLHNGKWHEGTPRTRTRKITEQGLLHTIFKMVKSLETEYGPDACREERHFLMSVGFLDKDMQPHETAVRKGDLPQEAEQYWCDGAWHDGVPVTRAEEPTIAEMEALLLNCVWQMKPGDSLATMCRRLEQFGLMRDNKITRPELLWGVGPLEISSGTTGVFQGVAPIYAAKMTVDDTVAGLQISTEHRI